MDKGLIKIEEIKIELEKLNKQLSETNKLIEDKKIEKNIIEEKIKYITRNKKFAEANKKKYTNIKQNIKKYKIGTIIKTTICSSIIICMIVLINQVMSIIPLSVNVILVILGGCASFVMGESDNYYSHKKYLKSTNVEEFDNEINVREKELSLVNKSYDSIQFDIELLKNIKIVLEDVIRKLEDKLINIKNVRNDIINSYIENNNYLKNLLNIDYESTEDKVLTKSQL